MNAAREGADAGFGLYSVRDGVHRELARARRLRSMHNECGYSETGTGGGGLDQRRRDDDDEGGRERK